ncbi:hypothetical protein CROQUDRAFT_101964 [Cronartium quercuum f. sp. fusiforme G11]|uniref:Uncharacterized protein n=1 Tax=Cronartium quercuum f. sp. fusiforme G11 TaxID=708437 RepID=A0A9P6N8H9_9BASI|nr:hypothetical protein CROQUDRAFT_101964 [Cronartium quercuum f. sp. fusiforme G11]
MPPPSSTSPMGMVKYSVDLKVLAITFMESGMNASNTQVTWKILGIWKKLYQHTLLVNYNPEEYEQAGQTTNFTDPH